MKYILAGNYNYYVTEDGIYDAMTNKEIMPVDDWYELEVFCHKIKRKHKWFYLTSKAGLWLPVGEYHRVKDVHVTEIKRSNAVFNTLTIVMQTTEPITIVYNNVEYAYILNEPKLAISREGVLLDTDTEELREAPIIDNSNNKYSYYTVRNKRILVHRSLLLAWVYNETPNETTVPNHIDGDKNNNTIDNLEWVSYVDNTTHAYRNKLISAGVVSARARNAITGEIKEFITLSDLCQFLSLSPRQQNEFKHMNPMCLINNWEVRVAGDERDWYYTTLEGAIDNGSTPSKLYNVVHVLSNKVIKRFKSLDRLREYYGLEEEKDLTKLSFLLTTKYPEYMIAVEQLNIDGPYEAYNTRSGDILKARYVSDLVKITKISKPSIFRMIRAYRAGKYIARDHWLFRIESADPWPIDSIQERIVLKKTDILVTDLTTGDKTSYPTLIAAAKALKTTRVTLRTHLYNGLPYLHYKVEALDDNRVKRLINS